MVNAFPAQTTRAAIVTLVGLVEAVNKGGVKVGGTWYDYGRTFQGERLDSQAIGQEFEFALVESKKDGKSYLRAVKTTAESAPESSAPEACASGTAIIQPAEQAAADNGAHPAGATASPEALKYAEDLALKLGISSEDLAAIVKLRFQKEWDALAKHEASLLIVFLGGYNRSGQKRNS